MPAPSPVVQPYLHELVTCLGADAVVLSGRDGQIRAAGAQGMLTHDTRVLSELLVTVDGREPEPVGYALRGANAAEFVGIARHLGDPTADPTVRVTRDRRLGSFGLDERLVVTNDSRIEIQARLSVRVSCDYASVFAVKHGDATTAVPPTVVDNGVRWSTEDSVTSVTTEPTPHVVAYDGTTATLSWDLTLGSHDEWEVTVFVQARGFPDPSPAGDVRAAAGMSSPQVTAADRDLDRLVRRSTIDLSALLMSTEEPGDAYLAAGSPWFFTLFGRDSLWAARMLLPLGTDLARGTLRILARRQGRRDDPETGEQPGKILHEVRRPPAAGDDSQRLPPTYYGTIDATALWVTLLHDAWRWGMSTSDVAELRPALEAALGWLTGVADSDGDGFLEYLDRTGRGLANQGWKDSGDSIQWPDGTIAKPPIALCEAQAYAHEAVVKGATLLDALGSGDTEHYGDWASEMRERFRSRFWVSDTHGSFPALALDGDKAPVASATSNIGHLLGTGLLDADEASRVAARLAGHDLDCGYGLRTLGDTADGFNPLGYHAGTVWPHDTAIAILGLAREGHGEVAASLATGLLAAAPHFEYRLPELFAGTDARAGEPVLAYPAACRPQAWSASAAIVMLQAALGLEADVPAGVLYVHPDQAFAQWFPMSVRGLTVAGHALSVDVDAAGRATVTTDAPLTVVIGEDDPAR